MKNRLLSLALLALTAMPMLAADGDLPTSLDAAKTNVNAYILGLVGLIVTIKVAFIGISWLRKFNAAK